jgi:chemotaxis protein MotB
MATKAPARGKNEPEVRPIIVKKVIEAGHAAHHGGAWKVAYADFVTAMMAFFLLMWLLGMTDEEKRKGIADYFTPTLVEYKQNSAGSNGFFGGDSLISKGQLPAQGDPDRQPLNRDPEVGNRRPGGRRYDRAGSAALRGAEKGTRAAHRQRPRTARAQAQCAHDRNA